MTAEPETPTTTLIWEAVKVTVDPAARTLWLEGLDGAPLTGDSVRIAYNIIERVASDNKETWGIAAGSREYLETVDAIVKVVTEP